MFATFKETKPKKRNNNSKNANSNKTKRTTRALRKFVLFKTTFYQVLCTHNPDVVGDDEQDFLEYLAEQVWDEGILQQVSLIDLSSNSGATDNYSNSVSKIVDSSNDSNNGIQLNEQEIIAKICEAGLYNLAESIPFNLYQNSVPTAGKFYASSDCKNELVWNALWLHRATNESNQHANTTWKADAEHYLCNRLLVDVNLLVEASCAAKEKVNDAALTEYTCLIYASYVIIKEN
ncbi:5100_t:CDS:2 [Ambispora leptoticha]|uniref:cellulase n=1 Tax=Ambispora leptoticha TaxID=144679 RepID=A0A9N8WH94_9GLOM|nr:5100_t:CDS:2 [Ambispora leptoticha]